MFMYIFDPIHFIAVLHMDLSVASLYLICLPVEKKKNMEIAMDKHRIIEYPKLERTQKDR